MLVIPVNGPTDYRLHRLTGVEVSHLPNGTEATADLSRAFFQLTDYPVEDRAKVPAEDIDVGGGRSLHVPKSLKGVAVFSFKRLCGDFFFQAEDGIRALYVTGVQTCALPI